MDPGQVVPPPPPGFKLDSATDVPPPPPGFKLDSEPKAPKAPEESGFVKGARNLVGSVAEPLMSMATGAIAKPASDVAGLASIPLHAMGAIDTDPSAVKEKVQRGLTYEPTTAAGKAVSEYNPLALLGKGVDKLGGAAERAMMPPPGSPYSPIREGAARGTHELINQLPNFIGAKGGKMMEAGLPGKQAALDTAKGTNSVIDATRDTSQAAGYKTPAETGIKAALQGASGKIRNEKMLSAENTENATRRLGDEVGVREGTALSKEEFSRLKEDTGSVYDALPKALGPELKVTPKFADSMKDALATTSALVARDPETYRSLAPAQRLLRSYVKRIEGPEAGGPMKEIPSVMRTIADTAKEQPGVPLSRTIESAAADSPHHFGRPPSASSPVPTPRYAQFNTTATIKDISQLRKNAKEDFAKQNSDMGKARLAIANQLEEMLQDNLAQTGQQGMVEAFRAARERFAKIYLLERITDEATGKVNLQKLAALSESKQYKGILTGEFKTAADFAKSYRKAAQKQTGEAPQRFSPFDAMFTIGAIAGGHPAAAVAELGLRYGMPEATQRGMLQNRTPSYQAPDRSLYPLIAGLGISSEAEQNNMPPRSFNMRSMPQ